MKRIVLVVSCLFLSSCASIIQGTEQTVTITSTPEGANVIIDGTERGLTPLSVKLKKNKYDTIMIKKKGYRAKSMPLEKSYDGIALLNVFWDSSTTDMITGAAYQYEPSTYHITLSKSESEEEEK